eukprot:1158307-Pelagomonas_calceolata.AAC.6
MRANAHRTTTSSTLVGYGRAPLNHGSHILCMLCKVALTAAKAITTGKKSRSPPPGQKDLMPFSQAPHPMPKMGDTLPNTSHPLLSRRGFLFEGKGWFGMLGTPDKDLQPTSTFE